MFARAVRALNSSFNPNWICRPTLAEVTSLPNDAFPTVSEAVEAEARPNCGVLNRLKNSERNCSMARSVMAVFLKRPKSQLFEPGPRTGRLAELPYV